jgi:hypothetical protein
MRVVSQQDKPASSLSRIKISPSVRFPQSRRSLPLVRGLNPQVALELSSSAKHPVVVVVVRTLTELATVLAVAAGLADTQRRSFSERISEQPRL